MADKTKDKIETTKNLTNTSTSKSWHIVRHEVQGRSHVDNGNMPCQDKTFELKDDKQSFTCIVLADGAGSAKYSHFGAECVCEKTAHFLQAHFEHYYSSDTETFKKDLIGHLTDSLKKFAAKKTKELEDEAFKSVQGILQSIQESVKSHSYEYRFDCQQELQEQLKRAENDIKQSRQKLNENIANRKSFLEDFKESVTEQWDNYEHRVSHARKICIKIFKKQERGLLKKIFSVFGKNIDHDIETIIADIQNIQKQLKKETETLEGFLKKLEGFIVANKKTHYKIDEMQNLFQDLEHYGEQILKTMKVVYKDILKHFQSLKNALKPHKDTLEIQAIDLQSHILKTKQEYEKIIHRFLDTYQALIEKEKALLENDVQQKERIVDSLKNDQKEHSNLEKQLKNTYENLQKDKRTILNKLMLLLKRQEKYQIQDMEFLNTMATNIQVFENVRKQAMSFSQKYRGSVNGLEKPFELDVPKYHKEIKNILESSVCDIKDLASTLLFVAVREEQCLIGHLGDGVIGALYSDGLLQVASNPDNGEHANETSFVISLSASIRLGTMAVELNESKIVGFVLMSDGGAEGLYSIKDKKLIPALERHMNELREKGKEAKEGDIVKLIERVRDERSFDDCSIAMMVASV